MKQATCCFLGHRHIVETDELKEEICSIIEDLIINSHVNTFLFGSKSRFNSLCHELVSKAKEQHPYIKRIYVRAEFPEISDSYRDYLLESYEDTYYPAKLLNAGKAVYIKRNYEMIDHSTICVIYYQKDCLPKKRKSGTKIALDYAIKKNKKIILLPHNNLSINR